MITKQGEIFLYNRLLSNELGYLKYIVFGTGQGTVRKTDTSLFNETIRKSPEFIIDLNRGCIHTRTEFNAVEIQGCSEIGLMTSSDVLICHDSFEPIMLPDASQVTYNYDLNINPESTYHDWSHTTMENVYERTEFDTVELVYDNSRNGYSKQYTLEDMVRTRFSYYHDIKNNRLYVHCSERTFPEIDGLTVKTR